MVYTVLLYGTITALATGLGALPFAVVRVISPRLLAHANAVASGLMLAASFGLVWEGTEFGVWQTIVGANVGIASVLLVERWLHGRDVQFGQARGAGAQRMVLMVLIMTAHSFSEGIAVGASFAGGISLAAFITVAIAVHNIPEGIAITAVLRPRGQSILQCAGWSIVSSLPQPIMAVPAFLFIDQFRPGLPYGIGFAAGAMVFMVFAELLPEAFDKERRAGVGLSVSVSLVAMLLFQQLL